MKSFVKIILGLIVALSFSACSPRGESKTLDEVLAHQKAKFINVSKSAPPQTTALLQSITENLDKVNQSSLNSVKLEEVADSLSVVIDKAGYTSRPALTELVSQYRALSMKAEASQKEVDSSAVRLLAARTYSILSSELETTKFSL